MYFNCYNIKEIDVGLEMSDVGLFTADTLNPKSDIEILRGLKNPNQILFDTFFRLINRPKPLVIKHLSLSIASSPRSKTDLTLPVVAQPS